MLIPLVPKAMLLPNLVRSQQQELAHRLRAETALQENLASTEKARADLADSQELLRLLLDGVKDYAIYTLDAAGNVTSWNAGSGPYQGVQRGRDSGQTFFLFLYFRGSRRRKTFTKTCSSHWRNAGYEEQGQRIRKDGSLFWADVVISPIYDGLGKHKGFTKIARDVTERKVAADEPVREQAEILNLAQIMIRDTKGRIAVWSGRRRSFSATRRKRRWAGSHTNCFTLNFPSPSNKSKNVSSATGPGRGN